MSDYFPHAMRHGSATRQCILILAAAIAGSAIAGTLNYLGIEGDIDTYRKAGAFGGAMLSIATGAYRW